jgi:radical SAM superfamily enzyme YgiQ (UPF0313 family)
MWHAAVGPPLSLGMLTAAARAHDDGRLTERFEIRRPERSDVVLADLAQRSGPAVLLCSNYVWSVDDNLAAAAEAVRINPETVVIHGGPSTPRYPQEAHDFLLAHRGIAHVLASGEGEVQICELLDVLAGSLPDLDGDALAGITGLTFVHPATGEVVRTDDRERIAELDDLPSPYTTGEFDHIPPNAWHYALAVETNRGCPYGCTFCDWGSATLSRIRKFSLDRVEAELRWAADRGVEAVNIADANFGIMSRDVETAERIAAVKQEITYPRWVSFTPAKNTTKHLLKIMDVFRRADVVPTMSISLQTTDPVALEAIHRTNISTDHYLALAADHRRHGHPLQGDVLVGIPEQTFDSYPRDLQFNLDHEILVRTWPVQLLPNSPMNDPAYREQHQIVADEHNVVIATATFTAEDRVRMFRLRRAHVILEVFAVLRHVLRWAQWDHGVDATVIMDRLLDLIDEAPERAPHLAWVLSYFDVHTTSPAGWHPLFAEVREILVTDFGLPDDAALDTVLAVNEFLMPAPGRTFPATLPLDHDYVAYYQDATRSLYTTGRASGPPRPLLEYGPGELVVEADPLDLCRLGPRLAGDSRDEVIQGDFYMATTSAYELHSPLTRLLPHIARFLTDDQIRALIDDTMGTADAWSDAAELLEAAAEADDEPEGPATPVPVELRAGPARSAS